MERSLDAQSSTNPRQSAHQSKCVLQDQSHHCPHLPYQDSHGCLSPWAAQVYINKQQMSLEILRNPRVPLCPHAGRSSHSPPIWTHGPCRSAKGPEARPSSARTPCLGAPSTVQPSTLPMPVFPLYPMAPMAASASTSGCAPQPLEASSSAMSSITWALRAGPQVRVRSTGALIRCVCHASEQTCLLSTGICLVQIDILACSWEGQPLPATGPQSCHPSTLCFSPPSHMLVSGNRARFYIEII